MEAGCGATTWSAAHCIPLASTYFNRKTTIYGSGSEVQRNIVARADSCWAGEEDASK